MIGSSLHVNKWIKRYLNDSQSKPFTRNLCVWGKRIYFLQNYTFLIVIFIKLAASKLMHRVMGRSHTKYVEIKPWYRNLFISGAEKRAMIIYVIRPKSALNCDLNYRSSVTSTNQSDILHRLYRACRYDRFLLQNRKRICRISKMIWAEKMLQDFNLRHGPHNSIASISQSEASECINIVWVEI